MRDDDEVRAFVQPGYESAATVARLDFQARCLQLGDDGALVMPLEAWASFLDALYQVREPNPTLQTFYEGIRYGFGFKRGEELLRPDTPGIQS